MLNRQQTVTIALLSCLVVAFGWLDRSLFQPSPNNQAILAAKQSADSSTTQEQPTKSVGEKISAIWSRTWDDPVAFYTFVLSIFTAVLAVVSGTQIVFLVRADKTARVSAEAAKLSAEAIISADRAHLFVVVVESNVHTAMRGVRFYGGDQSAGMNDARIPHLMLEFVIKNTGRTAAILRDVSYHFIQADAETTDWRYAFADTIVNPVIEGNSQTDPSTPCMAESELSIANGKAALDDERPLFFYGFVTFRDTFKRDHQYFWRYQYRAGRFALVHEEEQHPPSIY